MLFMVGKGRIHAVHSVGKGRIHARIRAVQAVGQGGTSATELGARHVH